MSPNVTVDLQRVCPLSEYREQRAHLFPSDESLRWFHRKHRSELISAGAILMVAGRLQAVPDRFDAVVFEVGQREAA